MRRLFTDSTTQDSTEFAELVAADDGQVRTWAG